MKIKQSTRFKRDLKSARKRALDMDLLDSVIELIAKRITLPVKYKDHPLTGNRERIQIYFKGLCVLWLEKR